jgi:hypothetical protein
MLRISAIFPPSFRRIVERNCCPVRTNLAAWRRCKPSVQWTTTAARFILLFDWARWLFVQFLSAVIPFSKAKREIVDCQKSFRAERQFGLLGYGRGQFRLNTALQFDRHHRVSR